MVVRIHLGQPKGNFRRLGVCAGLKILRTWFESTRFHKKIALWYNGSTTGFGSVSEGSTPSGATRIQLHGVMVAYQISVLEVVVRIHLEFIWSLWPRGLGASLWHLSMQVRILSNSLLVGSSNRSGLQIFNLSTRVRSSYRLHQASIAQW